MLPCWVKLSAVIAQAVNTPLEGRTNVKIVSPESLAILALVNALELAQQENSVQVLRAVANRARLENIPMQVLATVYFVLRDIIVTMRTVLQLVLNAR